ncbi:uncharacterized protein LOC112342762 [Selaginella moellendorffii]|uniref:uncharacterized protein LOC112342762 n=1 Tax=Selaginella moellendorffii TaxID=88036 RepID=UPI000D1C42E5|nr:uncharacterized protein LOC112342762 [Selaginella moellendorffii]|eukprot:XP_024520827.1 uncharacterized protein LOC112342762 [Selaginella moellendorffii]
MLPTWSELGCHVHKLGLSQWKRGAWTVAGANHIATPFVASLALLCPDQGSNLRYLEIKHFPRLRKNHLGVPGAALPPQLCRCWHHHDSIFCEIRKTNFTVSAVQQLLDQCNSLVYLWLGTLVMDAPGTNPLSSHSLDCLEIDDCSGGGTANVVLAIEMPKLRWLFITSVSMPCVELRPSTCNVEWLRMHGRVRYRGLCHSSNKLRSITLGNSFQNPANVMERVLPLLQILGGVKDLSVLVGDHDFQPRSFNLAALLELFQGLEVVRIARSSIKALSLDEWSNRKAPLVVHIETAYRSEIGGSWEADDVEFVWELLSSSDCVRLLDLTGFVYSNEPPDFQPQVPAAFEELSQAFPGRVKLHPLLFDLHPKCGMLTRAFATRVKAEPPYTAIQHWCKRMHSMETPAIESCAWQ